MVGRDALTWSAVVPPLEDEEISAEEAAAINEAHAELAAGEPTVSLEAFKRELGLR